MWPVNQNPTIFAVRAEIAHCTASPFEEGAKALTHHTDGLLIVRDGLVSACGPACALLQQLPDHVPLFDYRDKLLLPGFVDTHTHYSQTDIIASFGEHLLEWLERYAFASEMAFSDPAHADEVASVFCEQLLRNGTTTAMVFATVHSHSVDAIFKAAQRRHMRLIAGRVLMDRNCPAALCDNTEQAHIETLSLIERWHNRDRLAYAITPRFAPTSSRHAMTLAGELFRTHPDLYLQSHLAENPEEVSWVGNLYPEALSYLDVYKRYQQLGPRSVFAHCIWLDDKDRRLMADSRSAISFCPSSNLFLGSGLFDLYAAIEAGIAVGVGTDIGAGTSFSMLGTLSDAYRVLQLQGQRLSAEQGLYLATLGGARCLQLDHSIGNLLPGKDADFVIIDPPVDSLIERRLSRCNSLPERLFALMMLGDDRCIKATYAAGNCVHQSPQHHCGNRN